MQADEAGLRETISEGKNKECQGLLNLGILLCTQIWRPQGDLNPCRRRERPFNVHHESFTNTADYYNLRVAPNINKEFYMAATIFDAWNLYRELVLESASRRELISEVGRWKKHLAPVFKNMPLVEVRTLHVHKFRSLLEKRISVNRLSITACLC